jgi:hypothetical protein
MLFHKTFLNILSNKDELDVIYESVKELGTFNYDKLPKNSDTVVKTAPFLLQKIKKEQLLIETKKDYYVARDCEDNTVYICFKDLLVIDIDKEKNEITLKDIIKHFEQYNKKSFIVYSNGKGGYHMFCVSEKNKYRDINTVDFMINNYSDFYYTIFSYIRGFCVRLNEKFEMNTRYKFETIINEKNAMKELVDLVKYHEKLMKKYSELDCCYPKN